MSGKSPSPSPSLLVRDRDKKGYREASWLYFSRIPYLKNNHANTNANSKVTKLAVYALT